jgi:hypothetical protein
MGVAGISVVLEFVADGFHHKGAEGNEKKDGGSASGLWQYATAGRSKPRPYKGNSNPAEIHFCAVD